MTIGVIHPGGMGAALAVALADTHVVLWASAGRSPDTARRARGAGLAEVRELRELAATAEVILSACPPHAAMDVPKQVTRVRTTGLLYIDANSVAPQTVRGDRRAVPGRGGGRCGGHRIAPAGTRRNRAVGLGAEAAALFAGSLVATRIVGPKVGRASAVKACAGLRSKFIPAVWATLIDAAKAFAPEVEQAVREHMADIGHDMSGQEARISGRAPKVWQWTGEMAEAAT